MSEALRTFAVVFTGWCAIGYLVEATDETIALEIADEWYCESGASRANATRAYTVTDVTGIASAITPDGRGGRHAYRYYFDGPADGKGGAS